MHERLLNFARDYIGGRVDHIHNDDQFVAECSMVYDLEPDEVLDHLWQAEEEIFGEDEEREPTLYTEMQDYFDGDDNPLDYVEIY